MTSDFYFTAKSWFPGNVHVKPHSKHSAPSLGFSDLPMALLTPTSIKCAFDLSTRPQCIVWRHQAFDKYARSVSSQWDEFYDLSFFAKINALITITWSSRWCVSINLKRESVFIGSCTHLQFRLHKVLILGYIKLQLCISNQNLNKHLLIKCILECLWSYAIPTALLVLWQQSQNRLVSQRFH